MTTPTPLAAGRAEPPTLGLMQDTRAERLVAVTAQQISEFGMAAVSARSVGAAAGMAPSAVNYNFGGMERLLSRAFEHGAGLAADWLAAREQEILALPRSPAGATRALEYLVVQWTQAARPLALLYQERLAAPEGLGPPAWTQAWRDFWLRVAEAFGLAEIEGRLMHLFFEAEALYNLSSWSPALEAAALRELVDHFGAFWLGATPAPPAGALALAEQVARARPSDTIAPTAIKIMEAAGAIVEAEGLGGLTHRAVAARAGLTTGAVTHHFRTIEDLVAGAIRGQVLLMSPKDGGEAAKPLTIDEVKTPKAFLGGFRRYEALADQGGPQTPRRRHLFLAALRRPELAASGAVIRFAHGGNARDVMGRLFVIPPEMLSLHGGVMSRLLSTMRLTCAVDPSPAESRERLVTEIEERIVRQLPLRTGEG